MTHYHIPKNTQNAHEIHAVLSKDDGGEGIMAAMSTQGMIPLVFIDEKMIQKLMPIIKKTAKETGRKLYVVKYTQREDIEIINP
jgi:hypothetical protein